MKAYMWVIVAVVCVLVLKGPVKLMQLQEAAQQRKAALSEPAIAEAIEKERRRAYQQALDDFERELHAQLSIGNQNITMIPQAKKRLEDRLAKD